MLLTRGSGGPCGGYTSGRRGSGALWVACRFRSGCTPSNPRSPENVTVCVSEVLAHYEVYDINIISAVVRQHSGLN